MTDRKIIGAESLARWHHPIHGMIMPEEFIPIAEESGLIGHLGVQVMEKACAAAESWLDATDEPLYLTINKSAQQFRLDPSCNQIIDSFKAQRFPLDRVVIEITESVMLLSDSICLKTLNKIRNQGIRFFLDDFGTGYSSLSYLKKLPVDRVKIDRSFVKDVLLDKQNAALVEAIISMSHKLGLETIAEGIESIDQADYLIKQGCRYGQGYYFGKPVTPDQFITLITTSNCRV